ncbi:MAG TPA: glycerophosphodiester phosphodiesterase [Gaiellaceae bacterium]|nr:glycerophosphodiester phosphodiesterase [Gaiellaceae bacterium]
MIELRRAEDAPFLRVGHRGAAALAPENTIASLELAVELGCDLVEFDVVERGGRLVLAHSVAEVPDDPVSLDEALAFLAQSTAAAHVDLKIPGTEAAIAEALRRRGLLEQAVVSSFRPESLRALRALEPGLRVGLTYPDDRYGLNRYRPLAPVVAAGLAAIRAALPRRIERMLAAAGATAAMLNRQVVGAAVVERCHALGVPVLAWTVETRDEVERLDGLGVDGLIADDPRLFQG